MTKKWTKRPEGSNWGEFGEHDQLGRLNWIDPSTRINAAKEIQKGISFSLSLPLDVPRQPILNARRFPPAIKPAEKNGIPVFNYPLDIDTVGATDVLSDDIVTLSPQYSTQWDAFGHVCSKFDANNTGEPEPVGYNGFKLLEQNNYEKNKYGAQALGIDMLAQHGIQGRGVLIDLRHFFGDEHRLVGMDEIKKILDADNIIIRKGDIVCFHTGLADVALSLRPTDDHSILKNSFCALDGNDKNLLDWITESQVSALVADNHAVEKRNYTLDKSPGPLLPLHEHCLFKLGIPLGELWHLSPLAKWLRINNRHAFFLTAPPIYLPGMVGAPVNPIATV